MEIVECTQVSKTYQQGQVSVMALEEISLTIDQGEFMALAGPSGSGKTTLLNIIGGLDKADCGKIVVDGNSYEQMSQSQLAELRLHKIGFVFQAYNLIPVLSAAENVEFVMLPTTHPWGARSFWFRDPDGNIVDFFANLRE